MGQAKASWLTKLLGMLCLATSSSTASLHLLQASKAVEIVAADDTLLEASAIRFICICIFAGQAVIKCAWYAAALMWPYITAGAEKMVWEMLPPMLEQNKPTWMTDLSLKKSALPSCSHVDHSGTVLPEQLLHASCCICIAVVHSGCHSVELMQGGQQDPREAICNS